MVYSFIPFHIMSFLGPYSPRELCASLTWVSSQTSRGHLRWPGLDGFFRILVMVLLWSTLSQIHFIPSSSMYPTLRVGDRVIVEKASYFIRSPAVNDIITFRAPKQVHHMGSKEEEVFIKRIVAKAGDWVQVREGSLYVNGIARDEYFTAAKPTYTSSLTYVPKGHVYVLGDNRDNSYDSHIWGSLPVKNIIARFVMCCRRPTTCS